MKSEERTSSLRLKANYSFTSFPEWLNKTYPKEKGGGKIKTIGKTYFLVARDPCQSHSREATEEPSGRQTLRADGELHSLPSNVCLNPSSVLQEQGEVQEKVNNTKK